ncbi:hypothetical protein GCM10027592_56310 [Spirosoma flavus]
MFKTVEILRNPRLFFSKAGIFQLEKNILKNLSDNLQLSLHLSEEVVEDSIQLFSDNSFILLTINKKGGKQFYSNEYIKSFSTEKDANCIFKYPYIISLTYNSDYSKEYISVYDIQKEEYLWKIEDRKDLFIANNITYAFRFNQIESFYIENSFQIWEYTIPEGKYDWHQKSPYEYQVPRLIKAEIKRVIGSYQGTVWISLNSGRLLGLDEQTGSLKLDLPTPINLSNYLPEAETPFWIAQNTYLDNEKGKLFGVYNHYYWELDLKNPTANYFLYDAKESCQQHQILMNFLGVWDQDEIYFWEGSINNKVGIFNRATKQVIWSTTIEEVVGKFPAIRKVEYVDKRLYVLDHNNSLHIFERQ